MRPRVSPGVEDVHEDEDAEPLEEDDVAHHEHDRGADGGHGRVEDGDAHRSQRVATGGEACRRGRGCEDMAEVDGVCEQQRQRQCGGKAETDWGCWGVQSTLRPTQIVRQMLSTTPSVQPMMTMKAIIMMA